MGGILGGLFTPTEAGVVGVVYALGIGLTLYRKELDWRQLPQIFVNAATNTAMVLMVIATATLLSWVLTLEQVPQTVSLIMLSITENKYVFLILINLFLVVMGMFLDSVSGITILAPVLLPAAISLGVDPLFFGVMMAVNFSIGAITPPVGLNLYVTSSIAKIDIVTLSKAAIPFCFLIFAVLTIMVFFPETITYLPSLMK
jgi:C4-dicarboxylate transporter DctM subunit